MQDWMHSKVDRGLASMWWLHRRRSKVLASSIAADLVPIVTLALKESALVLVLVLVVARVYKCRMEHWVITKMKNVCFLFPYPFSSFKKTMQLGWGYDLTVQRRECEYGCGGGERTRLDRPMEDL